MKSNLKKLFIIIGSVLFTFSSLAASDVYDEIQTIESKKEELLRARNGDYGQEDEIRRRADAEFKIESDRIDEELLRIAEKDSDGRMLADVRKRRLEEKEKIRKEIYDRAEKEIAALRNGDSGKEKEILSQIRELQNQLKRKRVLSSADDPRILEVSTYAGDMYYWNAKTRFYIGSDFIFGQTVNAEYKRLTGKAPASITQADSKTYNDYLDTVDYYDEMLKSSKGSIVLEIEYVVEACPDDQPSVYKVTIYDIRYVNAAKNEVLQRFTPVTTTYLYKVLPAVDIRSVDAKYTGNKTITTYPQNEGSYTGNKTVTPDQNTTVNTTTVNKSRGNDFILLGTSSCFIPYYYDMGISADEVYVPNTNVYFALSVTDLLFARFDLDFFPVPGHFEGYTCPEEMVTMIGCSIGIYKQWKSLCFWASAGCGIGSSDGLSSPDATDHQAMIVYGKFDAGIDWYVTKWLCLNTGMDLRIVEGIGVLPCPFVGCAINFDPFF